MKAVAMVKVVVAMVEAGVAQKGDARVAGKEVDMEVEMAVVVTEAVVKGVASAEEKEVVARAAAVKVVDTEAVVPGAVMVAAVTAAVTVEASEVEVRTEG